MLTVVDLHSLTTLYPYGRILWPRVSLAIMLDLRVLKAVPSRLLRATVHT
jgi:hypothetical protein